MSGEVFKRSLHCDNNFDLKQATICTMCSLVMSPLSHEFLITVLSRLYVYSTYTAPDF